MHVPAIAAFKQTSPLSEQRLHTLLAQMLADKGVKHEGIEFLSRQSPQFLALVFQHFMTRSASTHLQGALLQHALQHLTQARSHYQGTREENALIDESTGNLVKSEVAACRSEQMQALTWRGAAAAYVSGQVSIPARIGDASIVIVGAGAAGVLVARALIELGFRNLLLLDQGGSHGGVWSQPPLQGASRANPFPLTFLDHHLPAAPGGSDAVMGWLDHIATEDVRVRKARVIAIEPGDLNHRVRYQDSCGKVCEIMSTIVINTTGVGEPLPPSRPGVMTTDTPAELAGARWQQMWTPAQARSYQGHSIMLISLSNSTLEMVQQIQRYQREGLDIDYHILTHYPDAALAQPTRTVMYEGHKMRLYRAPERMQLLRLAGDLPEVASAFEQARDSGRISSHVRHWSLELGAQPQIAVVRADGTTERHAYHHLYTLIGYGPRAHSLQAMGLSVNGPYLGAVDLDYDGEVQHRPGEVGRTRLYPGYFALGLRNAFNMNEVLLPGLLFRLPDLVAGVIVRAIEASL
jgi:glycine/D-amino acid oxidase-like deaminating enzyme